MNKEQPIGIFDSGIGGLTVANAVSMHLPNEEIIYFGDTAHLPYGDKSPEAIQHYSEKIADFLLEKNCKLILIACNTASALAYESLKKHLTVGGIHESPFLTTGEIHKSPLQNQSALLLNVIDPMVEAVAADKAIKKVGIIGTKGTISSGIYEQKLKQARPSLEVASLATALLASMIEAGFYNNSVSQAIINSYLAYPDFQDVEGMVLACTHYPLIKKEIEFFYHNRIEVYDSTDIVWKTVEEVLKKNNLLNTERRNPHQFYVSDYTASFEQSAKIFFHEQVHLEHADIWKE